MSPTEQAELGCHRRDDVAKPASQIAGRMRLRVGQSAYMNWESLTAVGTFFSGFIIATTAIIAMRQLDHLRKATQLEGAMAIFADLDRTEFRESIRFIATELPGRMEDASFRQGVPLGNSADDAVHKELIVLRKFEDVGTYVKHGLLDSALIYDNAFALIAKSWSGLQEVVAIHRAAGGLGFWENFEYLFRNGKIWVERNKPANYVNLA